MKVSIITDEISQDPETSVELAVRWGIRHVEIREVWGKRVPDIDDEQRRRLFEILNRYGANVVGISPGIFKVPASQNDVILEHLNERLVKSFQLARSLETNMIIVFSPMKESTSNEMLFRNSIQLLRKATEAAEEQNMRLALENEALCLADTGTNVARVVRAVGSSRLLVNWDPCNAYFAGQDPFPTGYLEVRGMIGHVHLKDCISDGPGRAKRYVPIGKGETRIKELLKSLIKDGYQGYVSIETHFGPKVMSTEACLNGLRSLLQEIGESEE